MPLLRVLLGFAKASDHVIEETAGHVLKDIKNVGTGRLQLVAGAVRNARLFEAQSKTGTGDWVSAGMFQNSREIIVTGLTPGTMYTFQLRAMGGSTGASDWSNPVSHMSL
jgi:hypothetical protein